MPVAKGQVWGGTAQRESRICHQTFEASSQTDKTSTCDWRPLLHTGTIALGLTEVAVAIEWHDQGWGNSKGTIKCVLMRASKVVMESSCGMAPHQQAMTNIELPAIAEASQPGDELQFLYQVRCSLKC